MSRTLRLKLKVSRTLSSLGVSRDWVLSSLEARRHRDALNQVERYVLFVGYPRSGHSLVGSLLNAHPDVVISHQLDALRYVKAGFNRSQLFGMIFLSDARFARKGRTGTKREYDYEVPGQWQGRHQTLRVIGDKRGRTTTDQLSRDPELLHRLERLVDVPLRFVHVTRNPYDNITTMAKRVRSTLDRSANRYFGLADGVQRIRAAVPAAGWHDLRHEDLIADPRGAVAGLCRFLDIEPHDDYLDACAGLIYDNPHRSRFDITWPEELVAEVARRMEAYPFLHGYQYAEQLDGRA